MLKQFYCADGTVYARHTSEWQDVTVDEVIAFLEQHRGKVFWNGAAGKTSFRANTDCCRHTYVSQMQALGVDLETIQSIVGHADIDMTKHYLHVQEPKRQEAVELFSKTFGATEE